MSIMHFANTYDIAIPFVVQFGGDLTEVDADTSPYDSRAGCRLHTSLAHIHTGNSPGGGGAIVTWIFDQTWITPTGYDITDYEAWWVEVSDSGVNAKVSPFAASTWTTLGGHKIWYAQNTTVGIDTWVISISTREIADTSNTDTIQVTMMVEGDSGA